MKQLTNIQKGQLFKRLANKSQYRAGVDFGLDKYFDKPTGVINLVNKVYREVKENPEQFAISQDVLSLVESGMIDRRQKKNAMINIPKDPGNINERDLVVGVRNKAWALLDKKLDYLSRNKKAFRDTSIAQLGTLAGISFDKAQIMKGEATEHIALRAKISKDTTPEEAMEQLLKIREVMTSDNGGE